MSDDTEFAKRQKVGRPTDTIKAEAFLKVAKYLEDNVDEQLSISDLVGKMEEYLCGTGESPYSNVYMKGRLEEHFHGKIVITHVNHQNIVTFNVTVATIIGDFYKQPKSESYEAEKERIIETAAKLIKSDIKDISPCNDNFPSSDDMESVDKALQFLPLSLQLFLSHVLIKNSHLKVASLGQAIIQATRPKAVVAPLQLGLAIQMHHHFASKFLIESLNSHGFCSSYATVQKYERSAAVNQGTDLDGLTSERSSEYVADNLDHNSRTLDGHGTCHVMGVIAIVTPGLENKHVVPKRVVTAEEIINAGTIEIRNYIPASTNTAKLLYKELEDLKVKDATSNLDLLFKLTMPIFRSPRPGWNGTMQNVLKDNDFPGTSSVLFLPVIDLDPSDMSCVYSTLFFVSEQAKRYGNTPILTFDQPLWWKAVTIVENEPDGSELKNFVLRIGVFHLQMSFLGSIGYLMAGSGLEEVLELVYAKNAVTHMLTGKAYSRAVRGHLLVDSALNALLASKAFNITLPSKDDDASEAAPPSSFRAEVAFPSTVILPEINEVAPSSSFPDEASNTAKVHHLTDALPESHLNGAQAIAALPNPLPLAQVEAQQHGLCTEEDSDYNEALVLAKNLVTQLEGGKSTVQEVCRSEIVQNISTRLEQIKSSFKSQRTAALWMVYMDMIDILRKSIKAERTGNWRLHLQSVHDMLPYFAASGHIFYAKSAYIYLQMMQDLKDKNPAVYKRFDDGYHVARRSDRLWAGLSTDLIIEQVLMRNAKTSGGLTRGKGVSEVQRLVWLMSMPACAEVNEAMQTLTEVSYKTSEQHKDATNTRKQRDFDDTLKLIDYLTQRDPFSGESDLRSIATGVVAEKEVNVDKCKDVGQKVLKSMKGENAYEYKFSKKDKTVTLASKTSLKFADGDIQVDPQLLFQRLTFVATGGKYEEPAQFFKYEMCSFPPALFDSSTLMRKANKPVLAEAIGSLTKEDNPQVPTGNIRYVLDGGALLHRIPWPRNAIYNDILSIYVRYVTRRYHGQPTIVFDGYECGPTTKDCAHQRRSKVCGPSVDFDCDMTLTLKKEVFLSNPANKQRFINLLGDKLTVYGCTVKHALGDADVDIVKAAVESAKLGTTILVGDDTDLLVLLCHYASPDDNDIFFIPESKQKSIVAKKKQWNITKLVSTLGPESYRNLLFAHAILGCDTTSSVYGLGKGQSLKKLMTDANFRNSLAQVFYKPDMPREEIIAAGEEALVVLYNGRAGECLDSLRYTKFCQKVATGKSFVQCEVLPPTSAAASYHSLRVYHQIQQWRGVSLPAKDWGWKEDEGTLVPIKTHLPPAHASLLEMVRCNCATDCSSRRCSCRKQGLECSAACGNCKGQSCTNTVRVDLNDE